MYHYWNSWASRCQSPWLTHCLEKLQMTLHYKNCLLVFVFTLFASASCQREAGILPRWAACPGQLFHNLSSSSYKSSLDGGLEWVLNRIAQLVWLEIRILICWFRFWPWFSIWRHTYFNMLISVLALIFDLEFKDTHFADLRYCLYYIVVTPSIPVCDRETHLEMMETTKPFLMVLTSTKTKH